MKNMNNPLLLKIYTTYERRKKYWKTKTIQQKMKILKSNYKLSHKRLRIVLYLNVLREKKSLKQVLNK